MRFLRIRVRHFGPLVELDTGEAGELSSLVAILGPNEGGKSSFHQAVVALLYGFYPASRDTNPLAPWSGMTPELEGWIRSGHQVLQVHRRLLSRPDGTLTAGDRVEELRNRELPQASHVGHAVFQQVYALTLHDLAGLEEEGWDSVQDRLVVGMGTEDLRSPRQAADHLEKEARSLWRNDRVGRPRFRQLQSELVALREERREAADRDRTIRELDARREDITEERARLRNQGEELDRQRARVDRLRPLAARLRQIAELQVEAGDEAELEALPPDPEAAIATCRERLSELRRRREAVRERIEELEEEARDPGPEVARVLEQEADLRKLADQAPLLQERAVARGRLESRADQLRRRAAELIRPLAAESDSGNEIPESWRAVLEIPLARLRRTVQELRSTEDRLAEDRQTLERVRRRPIPEAPHRPPARGLLFTGVGVLAMAGAAAILFLDGPATGTLPPWILLILGVAGLLTGVTLLAQWKTRRSLADEARRNREAELRELTRQVERLEKERATFRKSALEPLEAVPIRTEVKEQPDISLVGELERLRDLLLDLDDRRAELIEIVSADQRAQEEVTRVRRELPALFDLPADPAAALPELNRRLTRLARDADRARTAGGERERLEKELQRIEGSAEDMEDRLARLTESVHRAGSRDVSLPEATARASERLRARDALLRAREELRRDRPELETERRELKEAEARDEPWLHDPEALIGYQSQRRDLQARIEELTGELERIREQMRSLEEAETADMVDGRIQAVQEEMERVRRERDRRFVLARLIRVSEKRFREEHQPDLLRGAGEHLARITAGRYGRLLLADAERESPFAVQAEHLPHPLPVSPPLSTGTLEQVYLALRLAIVDHLDEGHEPLPLFLDEVLVNWDPTRRERGLDLLARVAEDRQVFLFTCHPELAAGVRTRGGGVIELPPP